jgi:hypothetical protein
MRRLGNGGSRNYLGNGSAADIEDLTIFPNCPQISLALRPAKAGSVRRGNTGDDRREVSRGNISWDKTNWGAELARLNYDTHGTNHPVKG